MDKNLTDNEIKKAWEVLDSWQQVALQNDDGTDIESPKLYEAIEVVRKQINRLQAENERLTHITRNLIGEIKAEAMTEFAEELKKESYERIDLTAYVEVSDIDNLLKEKVGSNEKS